MSTREITITLTEDTIHDLISACDSAMTARLLDDDESWNQYGSRRHDAYRDARDAVYDALNNEITCGACTVAIGAHTNDKHCKKGQQS